MGNGDDKCSFCHIDDVVQGHIAAVHKGRPGERYLLTGENMSFRDVFDLAASITKTAKPRFTIPLCMVEMYGRLSVIGARITGKLPIVSPPVCTTAISVKKLVFTTTTKF